MTTRPGQSLFPKRRHPEYRRWIRTQDCLLRYYIHGRPLTPNDVPTGERTTGFLHFCWGPVDPAHVGRHQAMGAPDLGAIIPLCRGAHEYYDRHRATWPTVTGWTEAKMANAAAGYALKWVERGGIIHTED